MSLVAQAGLEGTADLQVRNVVIEIRAVRRNPRVGWAEFSNEVDDDWVW